MASVRLLSASLLAAAAAMPAAEATIPTIVVTAEREPSVPPLVLRPPPGGAVSDLGATLRHLPGVDGIRMGGIGVDPVVRGQSASRVLVLADGACPHGGCPNRMDPPTTYAPAGADDVTVEPGGLGVRHAGAPAGVVAIDRDTSRFTTEQPLRAGVDARYGSNGRAAEAGADLAVGLPWGFARAVWHGARAEDYEDGDGRRVRSAYRGQRGGGTIGWTPDDDSRLEASVDAVAERDALYAGASMDSPSSDGITGRLRFRTGGEGTLAALVVDAYRSEVDHEMDNYSLRLLTGMAMRAPSSSDTTGARVSADLRLGGIVLGLGVDGERLEQDARRYSGMSIANVNTLQSLLWPEARQDRIGAFGDLAIPVAEGQRLTPGVRIDQVRSRAAAAGIDPAGAAMSPDALYQAYYGTAPGSAAAGRDETLVGAVLRWEWSWSTQGSLGLAASRLLRAADPTERFMAGNASTASGRWIGNPELDPEVHQQVQAIAAWRADGIGRWRTEAWVDRVQDYIRRDRARGQDGVLLSDRATVYHNGEALLAGALAGGAWDATRWGEVGGDAAYTWGEDRDTRRPLPQIAPLSGTVFVRLHQDERYETRLALRWAARQGRVDDDTSTGAALDAGETAGWAVVDWSLGWTPCANATLRAGIDNLFDTTYAEHLNKPSAFDTSVTRVNEPGRGYWLGGSLSF